MLADSLCLDLIFVNSVLDMKSAHEEVNIMIIDKR